MLDCECGWLRTPIASLSVTVGAVIFNKMCCMFSLCSTMWHKQHFFCLCGTIGNGLGIPLISVHITLFEQYHWLNRSYWETYKQGLTLATMLHILNFQKAAMRQTFFYYTYEGCWMYCNGIWLSKNKTPRLCVFWISTQLCFELNAKINMLTCLQWQC